MRNIMVLVLLLALCVPAMAQTENNTAMPDMVGKWTGIMDAMGWDKNTAWMPNETISYWPGGEMTLTVKEQNGKMFAGEMVPETSPGSTEMELFYQEVDMEGMEVASGIFKKA